jgi:hypothetical protein
MNDLKFTKKADGGHAFPRRVGSTDGMTLRDYFAAQALGHLIGVNTQKDAAILCYEIADAMLAERAK